MAKTTDEWTFVHISFPSDREREHSRARRAGAQEVESESAAGVESGAARLGAQRGGESGSAAGRWSGTVRAGLGAQWGGESGSAAGW